MKTKILMAILIISFVGNILPQTKLQTDCKHNNGQWVPISGANYNNTKTICVKRGE